MEFKYGLFHSSILFRCYTLIILQTSIIFLNKYSLFNVKIQAYYCVERHKSLLCPPWCLDIVARYLYTFMSLQSAY